MSASRCSAIVQALVARDDLDRALAAEAAAALAADLFDQPVGRHVERFAVSEVQRHIAEREVRRHAPIADPGPVALDLAGSSP